jgi:hypothetical protein
VSIKPASAPGIGPGALAISENDGLLITGHRSPITGHSNDGLLITGHRPPITGHRMEQL